MCTAFTLIDLWNPKGVYLVCNELKSPLSISTISSCDSTSPAYWYSGVRVIWIRFVPLNKGSPPIFIRTKPIPIESRWNRFSMGSDIAIKPLFSYSVDLRWIWIGRFCSVLSLSQSLSYPSYWLLKHRRPHCRLPLLRLAISQASSMMTLRRRLG